MRYDSVFKSLAEDDPRGLLFLLAGVPLTEEVTIEMLPREVTPNALQVDHVYRVKTPQGEWIWHIEVQTHYRANVPERILRYNLALVLKYPGLEIRSTLVLLVERNTPRTVATSYALDLGGVRLSVEYRVIRLWELDAGPVLEAGRLSLFPWVGLMRASTEDYVASLRKIEASEDEKLN